MRIVTTIAVHDLGLMLREKETLLWLFLMPVVFFWFLGTVTGGFDSDPSERDTIAVFAPADAGYLADRVCARLEGQRLVVARVADADAAAGYTRSLELPADMTGRLLRGERVELIWRRKPGNGLAPDQDKIRVSIATYTLLADLVVAEVHNDGLSQQALQRLDAEPRNLRMTVAAAGARPVVPTGFGQAIPGTLVMFTLTILLTGGAVPLVVERRLGLLRRLASAPLSRFELVLGKAAARLGLAVVQVAFGMLLGTFAFGMDWGPDLWMVVVVLVAWAALCAMLGLLAGNLAKNEGQAVGLGIAGSLVLAALGGCWWPIEITPPWMQQLAGALPTGWTMHAVHQLVTFQNGPGSALGSVALLLGSALALAWLAARTFRFQG